MDTKTRGNLESAIHQGNLEELKVLLKASDSKSQLSEQDKHNLLRVAIDLKHADVAKLLITEGFEPIYKQLPHDSEALHSSEHPFHKGPLGQLPDLPLFYKALHYKDMEMVKLLLSMDTYDLNDVPSSVREMFGGPLYFALTKQMGPEVIEQLIQRGFDFRESGSFTQMKPIQNATEMGNVGAVEVLLQNGAEVDDAAGGFRYDICDSPLNIAIKNGDEEMVKLLLKYNADANKKTSDGKKDLRDQCLEYFSRPIYDVTPLDMANQKGFTRIAGILQDHGARAGEQSQSGEMQQQKPND